MPVGTPSCPVLHARSRGTAVGPREMLRTLIARRSAWHVVACPYALVYSQELGHPLCPPQPLLLL